MTLALLPQKRNCHALCCQLHMTMRQAQGMTWRRRNALVRLIMSGGSSMPKAPSVSSIS
jgi:hypothetical protein